MSKKYTVKEVADVFRRDVQTIRRWISDGKTFRVVFRVKDGYLIPEEEVERVLADGNISREGT